MMIDSHAHLISADQVKYPPKPLRGVLAPGEFDDPMTAEKLLSLMDQVNVSAACAVQRAHVYGYDNDYILDSSRRYPDRLRAVVVLSALDPETPGRLRHLARERGAAGVRYVAPSFPTASLAWLLSDEARASWRAAADLGLPICIHVLHVQRDSVLPALKGMIADFPNASVVVDHVGGAHASHIEKDWLSTQGSEPGSAFSESVMALADCANAVMKFSTINLENVSDGGGFLSQVVALFGAERVIWGSDVGQSRGRYEDMVQSARAAAQALAPAERQAVLHDNALRIYGFTLGA